MLLNSVETKKYRGAYIHIINYWQDFVVVIFFRGKFYQFRVEAEKKGEYTNAEYLEVLDTLYKDARRYVEAIHIQRSWQNTIKSFIKYVGKKRKRRGAGYVPKNAGQVGDGKTQGVQVPE